MNKQTISTALSLTSVPSLQWMQRKMEELHAKSRSIPNRFVMTTRTLEKVRSSELVRSLSQTPAGEDSGVGGSFFGAPIESYATLRECMDRMMESRECERLQLIMGDEPMTDCFDHPYLTRQYGPMTQNYAIVVGE